MVIHHVFANRSNIGDWLSARGIQKLLAPHRIVEHLCDEPFVPQTLDALASASTDDLIVIGGGGLFMDYFTPFWVEFNKIAGKTPFCLWGVGYCDLKGEQSCPPLSLVREIADKSMSCFVRDNLTREYLANPLLPDAVGCPSVVELLQEPPSTTGVLHVDNYTTAGAEVFEEMNRLGKAFADRTTRPFRRTNNRIQAGSLPELEQTLNAYRSSDIVISSALHGCIAATAMRRKIIAVSGDRKIESFMDAVGLKEWVIDVNDVSELSEFLDRVSEQKSPWKSLLRMLNVQKSVASQLRKQLAEHEKHDNTS